MSDERFERDLTLVLREIAGEPSMSLRYRVAGITAQAPTRRRGWFSPPLRLATAMAGAVAVLALAFIFIPHQSVGPAVTASPSPSGSVQSPQPSPSGSVPSPQPSPSMTPEPTPRATPEVSAEPTTEPTASPAAAPTTRPTPVTPAWTSLDWSDPVVPFPYEPPADVGQPGTTVTINDVTAWNGGYVGVGTIDRDGSCAEAGFFRSTDGLHWDLADRVGSGDDHTPIMCPQFVARLGDGLIALGQERAWRSRDGSAWTELDSTSLRSVWTSPSTELVAMAAGPRGIVVIGQRANTFESIAAYSADGRAWRPIVLPARRTAIAWDAAATAGGFVIVGRDGLPDEVGINTRAGIGSPAAWYSTDGSTWREARVPGAAVRGGVLTRVLAGAGGLFAVGNATAITVYEDLDPSRVAVWTSAEGRSWQRAGSLDSLVPGAAVLASDGTNLVGLGTRGTLSISTDGRDWSPVAVTGRLRVPDYLSGSLSVHEPSPVSDYDVRYWVTGDGLIASHSVDSPEGFAIKELQRGIATAP